MPTIVVKVYYLSPHPSPLTFFFPKKKIHHFKHAFSVYHPYMLQRRKLKHTH